MFRGLFALYRRMATLDLTGSDHLYDFRLLKGDNQRFWPRWGPFKRGLLVLATYDSGWTITTYPGTKNADTNDTAAATHVWRGGQEHTYTDVNGLTTALSTAGYTAS